MSFVTQIADHKDALDYLKRELGEDNLCYLDLKTDFKHRMTFTFGAIFVSTVFFVGITAFCKIVYGDIGTFTRVVLLFIFIAVNMVCAVFEDSLNVGFWKWNRYYQRLWLKYDKKIPLDVLIEFSNNYEKEVKKK